MTRRGKPAEAEALQVLAAFADAHPEYARAHLSLGYRHTDRAGAQGASTLSPARREGYFRLAAAFDAALARNADDLFALATKEWALRERAARVEQDAARAAAFVQEADRVVARVRTLRSRTP